MHDFRDEGPSHMQLPIFFNDTPSKKTQTQMILFETRRSHQLGIPDFLGLVIDMIVQKQNFPCSFDFSVMIFDRAPVWVIMCCKAFHTSPVLLMKSMLLKYEVLNSSFEE